VWRRSTLACSPDLPASQVCHFLLINDTFCSVDEWQLLRSRLTDEKPLINFR
jgi:hypothetical protein